MLEKEIVKLSSWQKELIEKEHLLNTQLNEIEKMRFTYEKIQEKLHVQKEDKEIQENNTFEDDKIEDKANLNNNDISYSNRSQNKETNHKLWGKKEDEITNLKTDFGSKTKLNENNNSTKISRIPHNNEINSHENETQKLRKSKEEIFKAEMDIVKKYLKKEIGKIPVKLLDKLLELNYELVYSNLKETEVINEKFKTLYEEFEKSFQDVSFEKNSTIEQIKCITKSEITQLKNEISIYPSQIDSNSFINRK